MPGGSYNSGEQDTLILVVLIGLTVAPALLARVVLLVVRQRRRGGSRSNTVLRALAGIAAGVGVVDTGDVSGAVGNPFPADIQAGGSATTILSRSPTPAGNTAGVVSGELGGAIWCHHP